MYFLYRLLFFDRENFHCLSVAKKTWLLLLSHPDQLIQTLAKAARDYLQNIGSDEVKYRIAWLV